MKAKWKAQLQQLVEFVNSHSDIKMTPEAVRIPSILKEEYNRLFDNVREHYLNEVAADYLSKSKNLSQKYLEAETEVTKILGLNSVTMMPLLNRFLNDPFDALKREIHKHIQDFLKGIIDEDDLQELLSQTVSMFFNKMYLRGYVKWFQMTLASLSSPDTLLYAKAPDLLLPDVTRINPAWEIDVLSPKPEKAIDFDYSQNNSCVVSNYIIHSTVTKSYISSRAQFGNPMGNAKKISDKREWMALPGELADCQDLVLIYQDSSPKDIHLIADRRRFCRPDIAVICQPFEGETNNESLRQLNEYHNMLKPIKGTYLLTVDTVEEDAKTMLEDTIHILEGTFNTDSIEYILKALNPPCEEEK